MPAETLNVEGTIGFRVRLRWMVLEAGDPMVKLATLVARNNVKEHTPRIDDSLNSRRIEMTKVLAFLQALARIPEDQKKELAKGTILLIDENLMLGTAAPTTPESFKRLTGIKDVKVDGAFVSFVPVMPIDAERARVLIAKTKAAIAPLDEEIVKLEATKDPARDALVDKGESMRNRFQLAQVWRATTRDVAVHNTDPTAQTAADAQAAEAQRITSTYVVNTGGMPSDDEFAPL